MTQTAVSRRVVSLPGADPTEDTEDEGRSVPTPEELRPFEDDILGGLRAAASTDTHLFPIVRGGKTVLQFTVQSLGQEDYDWCRDNSLKTQKAKGYGGVRLPTDMERARFNAMLVYRATIPADRARIWDNKKAWAEHNVISAWDLINKVLRAFEIDQVVTKIDELSGGGEEGEAERLELAGNS